jgi:phage tail-like protein
MTTQPSRVHALLPRMMRDTDFMLDRLVGMFDELLDTVATPIEELDLLAHPALASDAMVDWLCRWLGWDLPPGWPTPDAKRRFLLAAGELLTYRGTSRGIRRLVEVLGGADVTAVEVADPGFAVLGEAPPVDRDRRIEVLVHGPIADTWSPDDRARLERLILGDLVAGCPAVVHFRSSSTGAP